MESLLQKVIESIEIGDRALCKIIARNEVGDTGGHQAGFYVPKNAFSVLFDTPGQRGENKDKYVIIRWNDNVETESRFVYYGKGTRNEYRITRFGKGFPYLKSENVGNLLVLIKPIAGPYLGYILAKKEDHVELQKKFGLTDDELVKGGLIKRPLVQPDKQSQDTQKHHTNTETEIPAKFKPRARLLIQLGDQLIKNESIALVELVKNSYDADANVVNIYMENVDHPEDGIIIIEDDGFGMTADIVENVWLEPGSDFKTQQMKALKVSPKYQRLPIGEKGIGRFGVHKLGSIIEMTTKSAEGNEVFVKINWTDFDNYKYLEDVPIQIIVRENPKLFRAGKTGTTIVISKLRKHWERGVARGISRSITALISPFEAVDSFKPNFDIVDKPGWFEGLLTWEKVKDYSLFHFKITLEGGLVTKFLYEFTPWESMSKVSSKTVGIENKLVETFKHIEDSAGNRISLDHDGGEELGIGKIEFEGYIFELDAFIMKLGVTDKSGFKTYLRENGGIRVFRSGLRVYDYGEPENDWLDLNLRRVNQPAKKISNNIVLGAVYLDRASSTDLIEKTNREGFVGNQAYTVFKASILHSIELVETLRYLDKTKVKEIYGPTPKSTPVMHLLAEVQSYVDKKVKESEVKKQLSKYLIKIEKDYKRVTENLLKAAGAGLSLSVVIHEVEKIISELSKVLEVERSSERLLKLVKHLSTLIDGYSEIISQSGRSQESFIDIIEQSLFNTEYRLESHNIKVIEAYKSYKGTHNSKVSRNLLISSLMNIIDNSIFWLEKAHRSNPGIEKKLFINLEENEKYVYLIIADNGSGFLIPTDDITEPFVSAKPGGIGLGLHIASEVMEAQKGRILFPDWGDFTINDEFKEGAVIVFEFNK